MKMAWIRFLALVTTCCAAAPHDGASQPRASSGDGVGVEPDDGIDGSQGSEGDDGGAAAFNGDHRAAGAASGVGRGTIVLETDPAGHPIAFRWAPGAGYHEHATTIALARAEAVGAP